MRSILFCFNILLSASVWASGTFHPKDSLLLLRHADRIPVINFDASYPPQMMAKTTFIVDTRNIAVASDGMYMAASFYFAIGFSNWSFLPMCDIGNGLWALSFINIPPAQYQYKFVNGVSPPGWEFQGAGSTCTNPLDNNNRFVTVTAGNQTVGPWCYQECLAVCPGNGPTSGADITPPTIDNPPPGLILECGDPLPPLEVLAADDLCDANATTTTGPPTQTITNGPCGSQVITRTWSVTDCSGNIASTFQIITRDDISPPTIGGSVPANITVTCGNIPAAAPLPASDSCDPAVTSTGMPTTTTNSSGCNQTLTRRWTVTDCAGNTTSRQQLITVIDNTPPVISAAAIPANITVACGNIPVAATIPASDVCDATVTATGMPVTNTSGLNACGLGIVVRTWTATDCSGNSASISQTITVTDAVLPVLTVPANTTASCGNLPVPVASDATATDNCSTGPTIVYVGETTVGTGCPYQVLRTWQATDCAGNSAQATQTITINDTQQPTFSSVPANISVCQGTTVPMISLTWTDNCAGTGTVAGADISNGMTNPEIITRTWTYTDACNNTGTATQLIQIYQPIAVNAGADQIICGNTPVNLNAASAGVFQNATWSSSGNGTFSNQNSQISSYTPGSNDLAAGLAQLVFTGTISGSVCPASTDTLLIQISAAPAANAGADQILNCQTTSVSLGTALPTAGVSYQWSGPGITSAIATLHNPAVNAAGTYSLTVTAQSGASCTATAVVMVSQNLATATANAGADQLLSCTANSVTLNGSNTVAGTFTWTGPGINAANANLPNPAVTEPGLYVLTVSHPTSGCTATDSVQVSLDSNLPLADAGSDQLITCLINQVTLNGSASESGPNISYQWIGPGGTNLGATVTQAANMPGQYQLIVTNSMSGCSANASVSVIDSTDLPLAVAGNDTLLTCVVTSVPIGSNISPIAGLQYAWTLGGSSVGSTPLLAVQNQGTYTLSVTNTLTGCSATDQVEVSQDILAPSANAGPDQNINCSLPQVQIGGAISMIPNGSYQWSGPNGFASFVSDPTVSTPGTYTLTVTNGMNGCTDSDEVEVIASTGLPTALAGADQSITCTNTQATLNSAGSSTGANISYSWLDASGMQVGTNATFVTTSPGVYTIVVTNTQSACTSTDQVTVSVNTNAPTVSAGPDTQLTCAQPSVTLSATGIQPPGSVSYAWSGAGIIGANNMASIQVGVAGTYTILVTNTTNGCSATDTAVVTQDPNIPIADAGADQSITCQLSSVNLQGSANSTQVTYLWTGPGITPANQNQPAPTVNQIGTYTLVVTSTVNGCTSAPNLVMVNDGRQLPTTVATATDTLDCAVTSVQISGTGSAIGSGITYQWLNAAGQNIAGATSINYSANTPGFYILAVTDATTGCTGRDTVELLQNGNLPQAEITGNTMLNCNVDTVQLSASSATLAQGFSVNWITLGGSIVGSITASSVLATAAGSYILQVTDPNTQCQRSDTLIVNADFEAPQVSLPPQYEIGCSSGTATLIPTVTASINNFTFAWSGGSLNSQDEQPAVSEPAIYTLVVTQVANGCTAEATTEVVVTNGIVEVIASATEAACSGGLGAIELDTVIGGVAPYLFSLNGSPFTTTFIYDSLVPGTYTYTAQDVNLCESSVQVVINATSGITVDLGPDLEIFLGDSIQIQPLTSAQVQAWIWNPDTLSCQNCENPWVRPLTDTEYSVTILDANGCSAADSLWVRIKSIEQVYIPTVINTNALYPNNLFMVFTGPQVEKINYLSVYSRWGDAIFDVRTPGLNDPAQGWDGTFRSKKVMPGVYVFACEVKMLDGTTKVYSGDILVVE